MPGLAPVASQVSQATAVRTDTEWRAPNTASSKERSATTSMSWPRGGPAGPRRPPPPNGLPAAEEGVEDVVDATAAAEAERIAGQALGAEPVVALPLLGVGEHLVGDGDLLEALLGGGIRVGVGVQLPRQAPVGALDVVGRGVPRAPPAARRSRRPSRQPSLRRCESRRLTTATAAIACG